MVPPTRPPDIQPAPSRLRRLVGLAESTANGVRWLGVMSLASALWLWWWLLGGVAAGGVPGILVAVPILIGLSLPSIVMGLLWWGLQQIRAIPERTVEVAREGREQAGALWEAARQPAATSAGRAWNIVRSVREIWSLVTGSRDAIVGYVALARLANPITLLIITGGILAAMGVILAGVGAAVAVLLF